MKQEATTKTLGAWGEWEAIKHYGSLGYTLVKTNYYNKKGKQLGEIDFIVKKQNKIIFVEVKTRLVTNTKFGSAVESVNIFKQRKLVKATLWFLQNNPAFQSFIPQIDVCAIEVFSVDKSLRNVIIISNAVTVDF